MAWTGTTSAEPCSTGSGRASTRDFAALYDAHVERIYAFWGYALGSRVDAEDLTQLTFERALRGWNRFDPARGRPATWLLAIAHNLLVDHLRATRRTPSRAEPVPPLSTPSAPDQPRLGPDPELESALSRLSPREREIVGLRFGGDLSTGEIAKLTGLRVDNVQQILSRALRRLRASIEAARDAERTAAAR